MKWCASTVAGPEALGLIVRRGDATWRDGDTMAKLFLSMHSPGCLEADAEYDDEDLMSLGSEWARFLDASRAEPEHPAANLPTVDGVITAEIALQRSLHERLGFPPRACALTLARRFLPDDGSELDEPRLAELARAAAAALPDAAREPLISVLTGTHARTTKRSTDVTLSHLVQTISDAFTAEASPVREEPAPATPRVKLHLSIGAMLTPTGTTEQAVSATTRVKLRLSVGTTPLPTETAEEPEVSSVSEAAACSPMAMRTPAPSVHVVAPATDASRGSGAASYARDLVRDIWRRARPKCHVLGASWPCTPRATEVEGELPAKRRRVFDSVSTPKFWL